MAVRTMKKIDFLEAWKEKSGHSKARGVGLECTIEANMLAKSE
jgi:hypothetical protein